MNIFSSLSQKDLATHIAHKHWKIPGRHLKEYFVVVNGVGQTPLKKKLAFTKSWFSFTWWFLLSTHTTEIHLQQTSLLLTHFKVFLDKQIFNALLCELDSSEFWSLASCCFITLPHFFCLPHRTHQTIFHNTFSKTLIQFTPSSNLCFMRDMFYFIMPAVFSPSELTLFCSSWHHYDPPIKTMICWMLPVFFRNECSSSHKIFIDKGSKKY